MCRIWVGSLSLFQGPKLRISGLYAASKRSLEILSETLRLELGPFGVTVLCVVNGAVQTNGQSYFQDWRLPENSLYRSIEETIANRTRGEDGVERSSLMEHANEVVKKIVNGKSGKLWCGARAGMTKFGVEWLPQSIMVWPTINSFGEFDYC
jgi:1-acylglycerone phosphate reductase